MATYKLVPISAPHTTVVNGRSYTGTPGTNVDVVDFDAAALTATGNWVSVAMSGTTAQRPGVMARYSGQLYHDNTLGYVVIFEGAAWRNPATGAAV
jgi:hypothetical protein